MWHSCLPIFAWRKVLLRFSTRNNGYECLASDGIHLQGIYLPWWISLPICWIQNFSLIRHFYKPSRPSIIWVLFLFSGRKAHLLFKITFFNSNFNLIHLQNFIKNRLSFKKSGAKSKNFMNSLTFDWNKLLSLIIYSATCWKSLDFFLFQTI